LKVLLAQKQMENESEYAGGDGSNR
jgi:hypothetical protein